jgi:polyhydroxybutyrate depolymerase
MTERYQAQRRKKQQAPQSYMHFMHHLAWGVVCLLLMTAISGIWVHMQSVERENSTLKQQLAAARVPDKTCRVVGEWSPNHTSEATITVNGMVRSYLIHTPDNFTNTNYYPLVMFYVGRGGSANGAGFTYDLDRLPAITIYPQPTMGDQNMTAWEGAPYSSGADDIAFTTAILDEVQSGLCIDRTHVYATGMSNGGGFAALLSCKLSDRFAAIAIVSGAMYPPASDCVPPRPVSLISIHGDRDPTVPYYGSLSRHLPPIETWTGRRAAMYKCGQSMTTYTDAISVLTSWNCPNGTKVQNVRIEGGGHAWGGVPNESLWRFLSQYSL